MVAPRWPRRPRPAAPPAAPPPDETRTRGVFFNRFWIGGAALALLVGVAAGQPALALLALLTLTTVGLTAGWNRVALDRVRYARALSATRAFPGDEVTLTLTVVNGKPLPLPGLTIDDELPEALRPERRETTLGATPGRRVLRLATGVGPFERVTWRIPLRCLGRGLHQIGPATLRAGDPFGFFTNRQVRPGVAELLVYPRVVSLAALGLPPRRPFGETPVARYPLADPARVIGARDYTPEDPFRSIHWKATARQMRLQVRVHEPTTAPQLVVFLNLDTFDHYWEGLDVETAERAIETTAAIAVWAAAQRYAVGVYANGIVAGSDQALRVPPGRDPTQVPRILEGLARLSPYSTVGFARFLRLEAGRLPWGSTLIVATSLLPEGLTAHLAALLARGVRVVLVPLGDCPTPALRGLVVRRVASREQDIVAPRHGPTLATAHAGIEDVAQAIAEEVEAKDEEGNGEAGEDGHPVGTVDKGAAVIEH